MKVNIGLFGGSGKMGSAIEQIFSDFKSKNSFQPFLFIGNEASDFFAVSAFNINSVESDVLADVDVWIDFTSPKGLKVLLKATKKFNTAVVSGSTGLTPSDFTSLKSYAKKRKVFWASNMSPGLWAFRQTMKGLSHLANFDFAIEEIHHSQKKDKPSGTAKTLQIDLEKIVNKKIETPTSLRLGGVFGVHTVLAASSNEVITLQHQALNRTVFAEGALMACDWLVNQTVGLYSMGDLFSKIKK